MNRDALQAALGKVVDGEELAHQAFVDQAQAGAAVRSIAASLGLGGTDDTLVEIIDRIATSADPQMAINNLHRFIDATGELDVVRYALKRSRDNIATLVALMAGSQFLSDVLIAQPDAFSWLISYDTLHGARSPDYYQEGAAAVVAGLSDRAAQRSALSKWRRREYLRIGCRDLLLISDAEEVSRDISDLAEAIIDQAASIIFAELSQRFGVPIPEDAAEYDKRQHREGSPDTTISSGMCVLGMGKLGGRELNFSSDIDLVFIYEAEGETTGREDGTRRVAVISNHDFFTRMGEKLIRFLSERGPDGNFFRVDMRLRPEGIDGPLVRSLEALIHYLNTQARDWERLAYLKARVVSGPARLAEKLYRIIAEFVFAGQDAARIISEVQELKLRIDREVINSDIYHREVKRGYGGIREIEFVIAAMQIIHGFHHHALRVRNTFLAIQRLLEAHILDQETADFYQAAYSFLRMIEHRLQMAQEAQTHTLPPPGPVMDAMARRCGFADGDVFMPEYARVTDAVHERFGEFFEHDTTGLEEAARDVLTVVDRSAPEDEARAALARLGIDDLNSLRLIHSLAYGTRDVFVSAEGQRFFEQMLPSLLRLTHAAPNPEKVFSHLHSFAMAIKGITYYYEVVAMHPDILKMLVTLFGTSDALAAQFIAHPEYFDALISSRTLNEPDNHGTHRRERLAATLTVRTPARRLTMLRSTVQFEQIVAALKYLLRIESLEDALGRLSDTADDAIEIAMHLAAGRLLSKWTAVDRVNDDDVRALLDDIRRSMVVIALGKYGGRELNFFGDLDVVFVYDSSREIPGVARSHYASMQEFYDAVADVLTAVLMEQMKGGRAYVLDARLRPHGKSAPLTTEQSAYANYLAGGAGVWELQAFTRARTAWGNAEILKELAPLARKRAYDTPRGELLDEIRQMRSRVEEAAEIDPGLTLEVKKSAGGVLDVEFLIQYFMLAGELPWDGTSANYFSLLSKRRISTVAETDQARLRAAYAILRAVENTIRLVTGTSESAIQLQSETPCATAVALGFGTVDNLNQAVNEAKTNLRQIWSDNLR